MPLKNGRLLTRIVFFYAKAYNKRFFSRKVANMSHPEFLGKYEFRKNMRRYWMYKTSRLRLLARIGRGQAPPLQRESLYLCYDWAFMLVGAGLVPAQYARAAVEEQHLRSRKKSDSTVFKIRDDSCLRLCVKKTE
jgi:hypothetical protein